MNYSKTYVAVLTMAAAYLFNRFGLAVDANDPQLVQTALDVVTALAGIFALVERFRKGGITILGVKK